MSPKIPKLYSYILQYYQCCRVWSILGNSVHIYTHVYIQYIYFFCTFAATSGQSLVILYIFLYLLLYVSPAKHGGHLGFALSYSICLSSCFIVIIVGCHTFIVQSITSMLFHTGSPNLV